jgi:hypothetical protein
MTEPIEIERKAAPSGVIDRDALAKTKKACVN